MHRNHSETAENRSNRSFYGTLHPQVRGVPTEDFRSSPFRGCGKLRLPGWARKIGERVRDAMHSHEIAPYRPNAGEALDSGEPAHSFRLGLLARCNLDAYPKDGSIGDNLGPPQNLQSVECFIFGPPMVRTCARFEIAKGFLKGGKPWK